eukprot:SAG31_NODE_4001_length_3676_cov_16.072127_1_plen_66_part_10
MLRVGRIEARPKTKKLQRELRTLERESAWGSIEGAIRDKFPLGGGGGGEMLLRTQFDQETKEKFYL